MSSQPLLALLFFALLCLVATPSAQRTKPYTAPETFSTQLQARTEIAGAAASVRIHINRYTTDADRKTITSALTQGSYPDFLAALRKAPEVGHLELGAEKFSVRWAREQPTGKGRSITVVTDKPIYFLGGGRADAKPRAGFELGIVQLSVDELGLGTGTMAAAARIKPDGQGGVVMEDYAEQPIKLTYVRREVK
jgi:hypothetical protein